MWYLRACALCDTSVVGGGELEGRAYSDSESESRYSAPGRCAQPECAARGLSSLCAAHGECSPAWFISESESTAACGHRCLNHAVAATSRKSKTCSNSKLECGRHFTRDELHSAFRRITFRVLANYIQVPGLPLSAVTANYISHFPVGPRPRRPAASA
jgi:hypothetical protein